MRGVAHNRWTRDGSRDELGTYRKQRILLVEIGTTGRGRFGLAVALDLHAPNLSRVDAGGSHAPKPRAGG
jgi:hypothetical protein